ncbi:hypothetical protein PTKIN_Ptkin02bG0210300 [Pterospermum kingtungense]
MASINSSLNSPLFLVLMILFLQTMLSSGSSSFSIKEATVHDLQLAFAKGQLTSRQLVEFYIEEIHRLNPLLRGVIEVNPDALYQADKADKDRKAKSPGASLGGLHGIPILLKDNIATKDKMNTTAGSLALLGSIVPRDAGVVTRLRKSGAIILGKASLSEWAHYRDNNAPSGWCAVSGQGRNPYNLSADPCGSSSGSAISVAANMAAVTLGTETDGSILCPSNNNAVVGIKPTVGLTSRAGVIPITPRQDTVGPMCRTVADAVYVLDAIAGLDYNDKATIEASKYVPRGGYKQFLKPDGLKGKRLGLLRELFDLGNETFFTKVFERHFNTLRQRGAVLVDKIDISKFAAAYSSNVDYESIAMAAEFKLAINSYLQELVVSRVRSLKDLIAFNNKYSNSEKTKEYGQQLFLDAEATNGIGKKEKEALLNLAKMSRDGFEKLMIENKLDALLTPFASYSYILARGGYPGIIVPAGYDVEAMPFGLCFGGLKGSEPKLIEIAYDFEQATKIRKPPSFKH